MPLGATFKLQPLTIEAFHKSGRDDSDRVTVDGDKQFEVMFNPETLSTHHGSSFDEKVAATAPAQSASAPFQAARSGLLTVKLVFDGTGAASLAPDRTTVADRVRKFLSFCYEIQGTTHEPTYLRITWGAFAFGKTGFRCRLKSADIQYSLFDRDGTPLHADVTATFVEDVDPDDKDRELRLSSPDLTHRRVVRVGDTLPALCREIYGSPAHHLRVARINDLDDPRDLIPGQELVFPPFARGARG